MFDLKEINSTGIEFEKRGFSLYRSQGNLKCTTTDYTKFRGLATLLEIPFREEFIRQNKIYRYTFALSLYDEDKLLELLKKKTKYEFELVSYCPVKLNHTLYSLPKEVLVTDFVKQLSTINEALESFFHPYKIKPECFFHSQKNVIQVKLANG